MSRHGRVSLSATFVWLNAGPASFLSSRCLCSTTGLIKNLLDRKDSFPLFQNYRHDGFGGLFLVCYFFWGGTHSIGHMLLDTCRIHNTKHWDTIKVFASFIR